MKKIILAAACVVAGVDVLVDGGSTNGKAFRK